VIVQGLAADGVAACNPESSETDVVHDHVRLSQHEIAAITGAVISIGTRHVEHPGTTRRGETVRRASRSVQLSSRGGATEMINDGRANADRKVLVKRLGENLLPPTQAPRLWWPGPSDSDSMPRKLSCRLVLPLQSRSDLGHADRGSLAWRLDD
jgi:hypothetical protein